MLNAIHTFIPAICYPSYFKTPPESPFASLQEIEDLKDLLTSEECDLDQWMAWKKEIKTFIEEHAADVKELDLLFKELTEWGMQRHPQKTMAFLVEIVNLEILTEIVASREDDEVPFENVYTWAAERAPHYPEPIDDSFKTHLYAEWRKNRVLVLHFIPNLINSFLDPFNFLDSHRNYRTRFDQYIQLDIICKLFLIPYALFKIFQPLLVVTAKVYLVSGLVIVTAGILIACYQRWLRPCPDEIVNSTNLDKKMEQGFIAPKVGQAKELKRVMAALKMGCPVVLIAPSGEGKTALVHHLLGLKQKGELPEKLQNLAFHEVDCGLMISNVSYGYSELIQQIKTHIGRHDQEVLLFFDDFNAIAINKAAFYAFRDQFLENQPHPLFIAAITLKEFQEIKKIDTDGSFRRRVFPIVLQSSDEQIRLILRELINRIVKNIPVTEDAIDALLEISNDEEYMPDVGRPAKAIKVLTDAIGFCRTNYDAPYTSDELSEAQQEYQELKLQATQELKVQPSTLKKIRKVQAKIKDLKKDSKKKEKQIAKVKTIINYQQKMKEEYYRLTHLLAHAAEPNEDSDDSSDSEEENLLEGIDQKVDVKKEKVLASVSKKSITQATQIMYLWYEFYAMDAMKEFLKTEIEKVNDAIPIQIDGDLIYRLYDESKEIEELVFDHPNDQAEDELSEKETEDVANFKDELEDDNNCQTEENGSDVG